ncbi:anaerobic ribonucleoside-triphosphate reductase activating protein [Anaerosacchariphilus sp. NSJ-68]|uniref:Anaerobic ribonucleoside-triphosphate reductase-activating protein n=2 Tax=Lachnospiraceae TaxID=186803 RepID=A0A923LB85_9FIRM|nr:MULTISPECIES: anaerobic ribonucleoside-triphosphate reductase activating protein [Lachnospiraceae]MBC5659097.1 anaerobic ribonucleoside-triphosphate reductase activating protein [Anaerosacchariphilus hominis]MBC5698633.1 anaerobic ribonucleoside-triphosphate reductase activating protein [Roseburia difficilis]
MNYAVIKKNDIANGPGVRVSLFVSGCRHHCRNCFNYEAWDFSYGHPFTEAVMDEILEALAPDYVAGLSFLGGEPLEPENQEGLLTLARKFKERFPKKTLWCYTGFTLDRDLLTGSVGNPDTLRELLSLIDVLVDGKFVEEEKDASLLFRGSANQNIIDLPASLAAGHTVLLEGVWRRTMGSGDIHEM